eukprot:258221-Alexandrium_andersonii.AAC.1
MAAQPWPTRPVGRGRPLRSRLGWAPSQPPPTKRHALGEDAFAQQPGAPRSAPQVALSECSRQLLPRAMPAVFDGSGRADVC